MAFKEIVEIAEALLDERGYGEESPVVRVVGRSGIIPASVRVRRSFGVNDDTATAEVLADQVELAELRSRVSKGLRNLSRHPRHLVESWAMVETLRRMGFEEKNMQLGYGLIPGGEKALYVLVRSGGSDFMAGTAPYEAKSLKEAFAGWEALWEDVMAAGEDELAVLYARSSMGNLTRCLTLATELGKRGMKPPALMDKDEALLELARSVAPIGSA